MQATMEWNSGLKLDKQNLPDLVNTQKIKSNYKQQSHMQNSK